MHRTPCWLCGRFLQPARLHRCGVMEFKFHPTVLAYISQSDLIKDAIPLALIDTPHPIFVADATEPTAFSTVCAGDG